MNTDSYKISDLSPHLFWDVDRDKMEWRHNSSTIIRRVLEYGKLNDWLILKYVYGLEKIGNEAKTFRDLDPVTLSFISIYADIPKEEFKCYTTKQLTPPHWNF